MNEQVFDLVQAISLRPADLSLRLDLADCLQKQRRSGLADWMRLSLSRNAESANINVTFPSFLWGHICPPPYTMARGPDPLHLWNRVRPDYWQAPASCAYHDYYGRWMISCGATSYPIDRSEIDELATMVWLETLWKDGLLELIEYQHGYHETAELMLDLPAELRAIPFSLNTAGAYDRLNKELSRQLLSWPSLVGFYLKSGAFAKGTLGELPSLAARLQFLAVEATKRSPELDELFDNIEHFSDLRLLAFFGPHLSITNLESVARSPAVTSIGILHPNLDRKELFTIGAARNLHWLGINSRALKRQDLDEFRMEFSCVTLLLSPDMQARLGPA